MIMKRKLEYNYELLVFVSSLYLHWNRSNKQSSYYKKQNRIKTDFSETRDDRNKGGWLLVIVLRGMRCLFWNLSYQESIVCNSCLYSNYLYDSMDKGRSDNWAPQSFRHDLPGVHIHKYCFLSVLPRRTQKPVHFR